ncbi:hypothetical protein JRO89_XS13G0040000 [Xanthoceras sorbifolium]|uniref:Molybdenum cofactor sulfurase n=1 Tax=Xanthoceras sorbifolium TaxID=99658 RepID=A0ABQ8H6G4_9ROSI|nr:hypothetical protein JRO89_XS13G0040000 [Xanthoceras sorbifolium]
MLSTKQRKAYCHGCCPNPFLGQPDHSQHTASMSAAAVARNDFEMATTSSLFPNPREFTNHESLPSLQESFSNFNNVFPHYSDTDRADQIRAQDYFHLSLSKHVCFDYIGHGLFSYSQLKTHCSKPMAASSSSNNSPPLFSELEPPFFDISYKSVNLNSWMQIGGEESEFESRIRKRIMAFMNISEEDYNMVFTANQSSAFKLLAESYPFHSNRKLVTVYDHENEAVQVMSENSKKRGASVTSAEFSWPDLRIRSRKLMKNLLGKKKKKRRSSKRGLFVFPLQSRMTGARYSYQWMNVAQENGWHVLLDASALGPKDMDTLGLSIFKPDLLFCSFYKIFGENPSGFGCLFINKSCNSLFKDSTVANSVGIVNLVPTMRTYQFPEDSTIAHIETESQKDDMVATSQIPMHEAEKTTIIKHHRELSFSEIMESETPHEPKITKSNTTRNSTELEYFRGLDHADSLGLILISNRARYLINWLVHALMSLKHPHSDNGLPLVRIYGPKVTFDRGPAIAFNVFDWNGDKIDPALLQRLADRYNISLSYGFLRHMWFSDKYGEEKQRMLETRTAATFEETALNKRGSDALDSGSRISVVTATLGLLTNYEDIYRLWEFVSRFLDADFVQKERWRYLALNQKTIEI